MKNKVKISINFFYWCKSYFQLEEGGGGLYIAFLVWHISVLKNGFQIHLKKSPIENFDEFF